MCAVWCAAWRVHVSAAAGFRCLRASAAAKPRRKPERCDETRRIGLAAARDVEGGAMIGRGAHEGQASVTLTPWSKASVLIGISAWS